MAHFSQLLSLSTRMALTTVPDARSCHSSILARSLCPSPLWGDVSFSEGALRGQMLRLAAPFPVSYSPAWDTGNQDGVSTWVLPAH